MNHHAFPDSHRNGTNVRRKAKIEAVIFDLDGTLVDSEPIYFESDRRLLAEYGVVDFDAVLKHKYAGIGSKAMLEDIKKTYPIQESVEYLLEKKNEYYLEMARTNTVVFPEMKKFLDLLQEQHYPLALASGSSPVVVDEILTMTGLKNYFAVILSAEHVEKGKPEPDLFLEAARRLDVLPENCLVVEDSQYGVEAAKRAFMHCIAIPYWEKAALPESYFQADLLFPDGMAEFTAAKAYQWMAAIC